jgi:hypothetical protein
MSDTKSSDRNGDPVDNVNDGYHFETEGQMKQSLLHHLEAIQSDGSFAAQKIVEEINPGLEVEGLGTFGMPLSESEIRRLIQASHQAPFGKGAATMVDTTVRNTWEINASQLRLTHPKWPSLQQSTLAHMCNALGVSTGADYVDA